MPCACDGPCFFDVEGTLSTPLGPGEEVFVVVRPIDEAAPRYFVQFESRTVKETLWKATAQIGSTNFPATAGDRLDVLAIVVDTSMAGSPPVGSLADLSEASIPGLLTVSASHTLSVMCNDGDPEARLFDYLDAQQHAVTGLLESYTPNDDLPAEFRDYLDLHPGFVYDNALAALALLDRAHPDDLDRARRILDAFRAIQDPATHALPDVVNVETLEPLAWDYGTGNQMWAVLALLKAYRMLGDSTYLDTAEQIGNFVLEQKNTVGYSGFTLFPGSTRVGTEHNVDAYAGFSQLATEFAAHGDADAAALFQAAAAHARIFVESRFDPYTGKTFTGTDDTGVTTNTFPVPEDTQTWTLLALGGSKWQRGFDWLLGPEGLWTQSTRRPTLSSILVQGPSFSDADSSETWFEGVPHVWLSAILLDNLDNPVFDASSPEETLRAVQESAPHADGYGLVATCDTLDTGFGFSYFNALAVAPTAWAIFAFRDFNPFWDEAASANVSTNPAPTVPWVALNAPSNQAFTCETGGPCAFTVSGSSSGVVGGANLAIYVLVRPTNPSAGATFTQFPAAAVQEDGTWSATVALGSAEFPASSGDMLEVSAMIVDMTSETPAGVLDAVTPDEVSGLVAVTGIVSATVQVGS